MKIKIVHMPVQLTDAELRAKGKQQAETMVEYGEIEAERKALTATFAAKMKERRKILDKLAVEVRTGFEVRPVECELVPRWGDHTVITVRRDTGEHVDTRPMSPGERQLELRTFEAEDDPTGKPN